MANLEEFANDVNYELKDKEGVDLYANTGTDYSSIIVILMIISIIVSVLRLIQVCRQTHSDVIKMAESPSLLLKLMVRKHVYVALKRFPGAYSNCGRN